MEKVVVWVVIEKIAVVEVFRGANRCWVVVYWCVVVVVVVIDWCGRLIQMHCIVVVRYGRRQNRNNIDWCGIVVVRYSRRRDRNDIDWCGIVIDIERRIQRHCIDIVIKRRPRDGLHDGLICVRRHCIDIVITRGRRDGFYDGMACVRRQGRQEIDNTRLRYA